MNLANVDHTILINEKDINIVCQIGKGAHGIIFEGKRESTNAPVSYQH